MSIRGVREEPVAEFKAHRMHATLYRLSPRRHRLDTFDDRNVRGTYLSIHLANEIAAKEAIRTAVDKIMDAV